MEPGLGKPGSDIDAVLGILSSPHDDDLADVVELVATLCAAEAAGITIARGDEYVVPITYGIAPFVCPSSDTFCQHTMGADGVVTIPDAREDPRFREIGWVDGRFAAVRFYASAPIHAPSGDMVGRLCVIDSIVRDLTPVQRHSLERLAADVSQLIELRLLRASRTAPAAAESGQAAATVVSQLAAELGHDLRVPLSSITASVEMLQQELEDHPSDVVEALLVRTARAAGRMGRMLDQSMQYGTAGEEPTLAAVDLAQVTAQLLVDNAALLQSSDAYVEAEDLPVVHADADDMYSVLQNLLTNALKFARPGAPPVVRISARQVRRAWRISVVDNGVGIPEERRVDVFSLFSRVPSHVEGHGIGLATVARIAQAHGGRAGAEALDGPGTEVWFEIPEDSGDVDEIV